MSVADRVPDADSLSSSPARIERKIWWGLFRAENLKRRIVAFVAASFVSGILEAALLALVARLAVVIGGGVRAAPPWPLSVLGERTVTELVAIGIAACVLRLLCQVVVASVPARLVAEVQAHLRRRVVAAFGRANWLTQLSVRDGRLQETATGQIEQTATALLVFLNGSSAALSLIVLLASALILNPPAAAAILGTIGVLYVLLNPLARLVKRSASATVAANVSFATTLSETGQLNTEAHTLGVTEPSIARLDTVIEEAVCPLRRTTFIYGLVPGLYQSCGLALILISLLLAHRAAPSSLGTLGAVVLILLRVLSYGSAVQSTAQRLSGMRMYAVQLSRTVEKLEKAHGVSGTKPLGGIETVQLRNAGYAYDRGPDAMRDATADIEAGDLVGITGPSGSGKTTLANVLCRLLPPTSGTYVVNGRPAVEYGDSDWARRFAFVPQEGRLMTGTISDNITFFRTGFSHAEVITAAKEAHIHDEIMAWPAQYQTKVGQRADAVSGGQRQRLCLARALVGSPEVLILDEPTSALDPRSEELVLRTLADIRGRVTMIVITHRSNVLNLCDYVFQMKAGQLEMVKLDEQARPVPAPGE